MWTGVAACVLCSILGVWKLVRGKYLTAAFECIPAFYGAMIAEIARRELRKSVTRAQFFAGDPHNYGDCLRPSRIDFGSIRITNSSRVQMVSDLQARFHRGRRTQRLMNPAEAGIGNDRRAQSSERAISYSTSTGSTSMRPMPRCRCEGAVHMEIRCARDESLGVK